MTSMQKFLFPALGIAAAFLFLASPSISFADPATCVNGVAPCGVVAPYSIPDSVVTINYSGSGSPLGGETCNADGSGSTLPSGWSCDDQSSTIPSGEWLDATGYYNDRIYPGNSVSVTVHPFDDNGSASVGSFSSSYSGCQCGQNDIVKPGCGGAGTGNGGSGSATVNPGDQLNLSVTNACKASGGPAPFGGGRISITGLNATYCYTATSGLTGGITYHPDPTTPGQCDGPATPTGTVSVVSENSQNNQPTPSSWFFTAAPSGATVPTSTSDADSGVSKTYLSQPAQLHTYGIQPISSSFPPNFSVRDVSEYKYVAESNSWLSVAIADSVGGGQTQDLSTGGDILFDIDLDPIAALSVNPTTQVVLSASSPTSVVTVTNSGAPSSTLGWTESISYASGTGWLAIGPSSGGSIDSGQSSALTFSASAGSMSPGTYAATVTFSGTSSPTLPPVPLSFSVPVTFTIPPPGLSCTVSPAIPVQQTTVGQSESFTFTAFGGGSTYSWPGGVQGNSYTYTTSSPVNGYQISVTSGGSTVQCPSITVTERRFFGYVQPD